MKGYIFAIVVCGLAFGCSGTRSTQTDHNSHITSSNTNANSTAIDHRQMGHANPGDHGPMQSSPNAASAPFELQFIDTMIVHHQGAVDMAMLAESRAEHKEVKELAANIVDAQEREIARMSEWRDSWFGEKAKAVNMSMPGMSHGMDGMDLKKLASLKGNAFDVEFIRQMIPHHEGAVEMAKHLHARDSTAELKEFAADIIDAQESEIAQMRTWLAEWQK
jgi:uncharacterized protein (DUF305 family)